MTEYLARQISSLNFEVTRDNIEVGTLSYAGWFSFSATMQVGNHATYQVEPKGFWGTTVELKDGETLLLKFKMNWSGEIVLQTFFNNQEQGYIFKMRGIFKDSFILKDQEGTELLNVKPQMKWSKLNYEYLVTTSDQFDSMSNKEILVMSTIHCSNYFMSMMLAS